MNYEQETREAYRNKEKAENYRDQYIKGFKWARFTMWKQTKIIKKFLKKCNFSERERVLDIPCGTGYIGPLLEKLPADIFASDISMEMIELARNEYGDGNFHGFVQSDITQNPFREGAFSCVIVLALMHRLPEKIRQQVLKEITQLSEKYIIISYSLDNFPQRLKLWFLKRLRPSHIPAPSSIPLRDIMDELTAHDLNVRDISHVVYLLSAKIVFLLEKGRNQVLSSSQG